MTILKHLSAVAAAIAVCSSAVRAQQYRVELALTGGMVTHADFRPCPAGQAVSDCGAAVAHPARSEGTAYTLATRSESPNGHDSVTIENGAIRITPLDGRKPPFVLLHVGDGVARAVVISADSRYAFVVVEHTSGNPSDVMMIDLPSQDVVSGVGLDSRVVGIAMAQ